MNPVHLWVLRRSWKQGVQTEEVSDPLDLLKAAAKKDKRLAALLGWEKKVGNISLKREEFGLSLKKGDEWIELQDTGPVRSAHYKTEEQLEAERQAELLKKYDQLADAFVQARMENLLAPTKAIFEKQGLVYTSYALGIVEKIVAKREAPATTVRKLVEQVTVLTAERDDARNNIQNKLNSIARLQTENRALELKVDSLQSQLDLSRGVYRGKERTPAPVWPTDPPPFKPPYEVTCRAEVPFQAEVVTQHKVTTPEPEPAPPIAIDVMPLRKKVLMLGFHNPQHQPIEHGSPKNLKLVFKDFRRGIEHGLPAADLVLLGRGVPHSALAVLRKDYGYDRVCVAPTTVTKIVGVLQDWQDGKPIPLNGPITTPQPEHA